MKLINADVMEGLAMLPDESVQCVVTSPPYWGLRDYGIEPVVWGGEEECRHEWGPGGGGLLHENRNFKRGTQEEVSASWTPGEGEGRTEGRKGGDSFCLLCGAWRGSFGLEPSIELYIEHTVAIFREVRRVLRPDGVLFLNLGDSYYGGGGAHKESHANPGISKSAARDGVPKSRGERAPGKALTCHNGPNRFYQDGLKPKDLCMVPAQVALALRVDGWWLRSEITWCKKSPMPESCTDRPTNATEKIFLLTKSPHYFYDAEAVRMPSVGQNEHDLTGPGYHAPEQSPQTGRRSTTTAGWATYPGGHGSIHKDGREKGKPGMIRNGRNLWNYWILGPAPFKDAHFATFVPELVRLCVSAGTSERGCCPKCGSPWRRVVEKTFVPQGDVSLEKGIKGAPGQKPMDASSSWDGVPRGSTHATTTGWTPTCKCNAGDPIPCTVLDPFSGAGTTALVAAKLGRHAIGIELNSEYVEMSRKRIVGEMGMLAEVEVIAVSSPTSIAGESP